MESSSSLSLFSLAIDPITKTHLSEVAKWARFLAIAGMIVLALMILFGLFGSAMLFSTAALENQYGGAGAGIFAAYIVIMAIIWFFPLLFTMRFASNMRKALASDDQEALNTSFQNLKICLRYLGIITIIAVAFMAIGVVFALISVAAFA